MPEAVLYSSSDRIAVTTLNRPAARNAVDRDVALGLEAAVDQVEDDPDIAGGLDVGLAVDLVVATTRPAFGLAGVKRNLIARAGGLFRLPRAISRATAMDAILTGEPIDTQRAFDRGLVSGLVAPGAAFDEAIRVAEQISSSGRLAVTASRRVVLSAVGHHDTPRSLPKALLDQVLAAEGTREGLTAFVERRPPRWTAR